MVNLYDVETGDLIVGKRKSPYFIENGTDNHTVFLVKRVISVAEDGSSIDALVFHSFGKHSRETCGTFEWKDNNFWTFELVKVKPKPFRSIEMLKELSNDRRSQ